MARSAAGRRAGSGKSLAEKSGGPDGGGVEPASSGGPFPGGGQSSPVDIETSWVTYTAWVTDTGLDVDGRPRPDDDLDVDG